MEKLFNLLIMVATGIQKLALAVSIARNPEKRAKNKFLN